MTERIDLTDDSWVDYNSKMNKRVAQKAMTENLRFGEAFVAIVAEDLGVNLSEIHSDEE